MVLSQSYISTLRGDAECLEALAWLAAKAERYPPGRFVPPLKPQRSDAKQHSSVALYFRVGRKSLRGGGARITRIDGFDGDQDRSIVGDSYEMAKAFAKEYLTTKRSGSYLICTGRRRRVLEIWLDTFGQQLCDLGYELLPAFGSEGCLFIKFRRSRRTWTLCLFEGMTGLKLDTSLSFALDVSGDAATFVQPTHRLYNAIAAVRAFLLQMFGGALRPTIGMTAMDIARRHLPDDFCKWRPDPLLVSMERHGKGYRGGTIYARKYRGPSWRVDVNRQYTHALRTQLPYASAFGKYVSTEITPHGVFVCRVQFGHEFPVSVGIWCGKDRGFQVTRADGSSVVCILHTAEFPGLLATGAKITPEYGFIHTKVFSLESVVESITAVLTTFGKTSPEGQITKPIGNYIYGKFGQNPHCTETMYANHDPGKDWFPYYDEDGQAWEGVWTRDTSRYTSSQHVDIAGTITAAARSQTMEAWQTLEENGVSVVRIYTDSITTARDPSPYLDMSDSAIGAWKTETEEVYAVIASSQAFIQDGVAHIAGIRKPTAEMVERIHDGLVVEVSQFIMSNTNGQRGKHIRVTRTFAANSS